MLGHIKECTAPDGLQKLLDENQFLFDALQSLENQLSTIHSTCLEKQQLWNEFKHRFDAACSSFQHSTECYQENQIELDELRVFENFRLFITFLRVFRTCRTN